MSRGIHDTAWQWFASYLEGGSYQLTHITSAPFRPSDMVSHKAMFWVFFCSSSIPLYLFSLLHIALLTQLCRFLLYNIMKIPPFLFTETAGALVQYLVILRWDYCIPLLSLHTIHLLQLIQNAAACLVFNYFQVLTHLVAMFPPLASCSCLHLTLMPVLKT